MIVGAVLSSSVMVVTHCAVFPFRSSAVSVTATVVWSPVKVVPIATLCVSRMSPIAVQLSVALTCGRRSARSYAQFASTSTLKSTGQRICGSMLSSSVTVNVQLSRFPLPSSATIVTWLASPWPISWVPGAGRCVRVIAPAAAQLSVTVACAR